MQELSMQEVDEVSGAVVPLVIAVAYATGFVAGMTFAFAIQKH